VQNLLHRNPALILYNIDRLEVFMAKTIRSLDDIRPNIFEALKRAYVHMGLVRAPRKPPADISHKKNSKKSPNDSDDTYMERVAAGEPDSQIEAEGDGQKKSLEKPPPDSKSAAGPETLTELTTKSQDVLYEASTMFPFTLVPDTITLDREKLTIANRFFWRVAKITSVPVGEVMSAEVSVGPFFGSLHLTFRFFANNERVINFLSRHDAVELQRLIHGYIVAHRREIDVTSVEKGKLVALLTELGQGASD
jgi:hypothetical protein